MKNINALFVFVTTACAVVSLSACQGITCKTGSGKMVTETREAKGFNKIDISGSFDVNVKQDSVELLTITADDNLIDAIKSGVNGNNLQIKTKGSICSSGKLVLNISLRDLSKIQTSGAVNLSSNGKLTVKDLAINASGATKISLDLIAGNVVTTGSGTTELNLKGQASSHKVDFSGSGEINALDFVVSKYTIGSSGASQAKINVLNELNVSSSGTSDVEYRGNPAKIHEDKSGTSSLKKVD